MLMWMTGVSAAEVMVAIEKVAAVMVAVVIVAVVHESD